MATIPKLSTNESYAGLGTFNIAIPSTDLWTIAGKMTLPTIATGAASSSQVVTTIKINNGATLFTSQAGAEGFYFGPIAATSGSTFNVTLSSNLQQDQQINGVKTTISLF